MNTHVRSEDLDAEDGDELLGAPDTLRAALVLAAGREEKSLLAAQWLFDRGNVPSVNAVRELTGTGSNTDIARDLKKFWAAVRKKAAVPPLPPSVATLAEQLWQQAVTEADARHLSETARHFSDMKALQQRLEGVTHDRESLAADLQRALDDTHDHLARIGFLERRIADLTKEYEVSLATLRVRLKTEQSSSSARITALESDLDHERAAHAAALQAAEQRFMAALAAEQAARARDAEVLEGEAKFSRLQVDEARQHAKGLEKENADLRERERSTERKIGQLEAQVALLRVEKARQEPARGRRLTRKR